MTCAIFTRESNCCVTFSQSSVLLDKPDIDSTIEHSREVIGDFGVCDEIKIHDEVDAWTLIPQHQIFLPMV